MEIAPMGVQMTYANAGQASQVQHDLNNATALQQNYAAVEEQRDAELKQSQVRNKDNAEGGAVKDDPERRKRNGGLYYRASKKNDDAEEEQPEKFAVDPKRGRFLDISL